MTHMLHRLAAFATTADGGNPAGVWIGDSLPANDEMQRIATEVGYSETAFVAPRSGARRTIRFFSPVAEVSFCGHATIATGVVLGGASGEGTYQLATAIGDVPVSVRRTSEGAWNASLTSVDTLHEPASPNLLGRALSFLGWNEDELDNTIPPARAWAGAWHLILAAATRERLARLHYDFDALRDLMLEHDLTTIQLIWRESTELFHARDPFPVGGVVEDPATGAAAAALGGYLRDARLIGTPTNITIRQGVDMGRPSTILVEIPPAGGIIVTGTAVPISD